MEAVYRVKLYKLDTDGNWADRGTGQISVTYLESEAMGLIVLSEAEDHKTLLVHKLSSDDIYQCQDGTIISWADKDLGTDVAVSFEKPAGCQHVWDQIKQVQVTTKQEPPPEAEELEGRLSGDGGADLADGEESALPMPEVGNLEEIVKAVCTAGPQVRDRLSIAMLRAGWIPTLLDVFKQCEDLDDFNSLGLIFRLVRGAIMLNDAALLEELLREEHVMDVVGALEIDPELPAPQRHRDFLATHVVFKQVVPIRDPAVLAKIHQTYRIQYIKDVILPRSLDDSTYATLSSLALFNNVEVVSALSGDPAFLAQLFEQMREADPASSAWADLVAFLQEFCNLARHLQQNSRQQLFSKLVQLGLFDQVTRIMQVGSEGAKLRATDVLLATMQHDTAGLRTYLMQQKDSTLLGLLVSELADGTGEGGLPEQVVELLKLLVDPDSLRDRAEKSELLDIFYDKFMGQLLGVILSDKTINPKEGTRTVPSSTLNLILDFMSFCVVNHGFRMKYYCIRQSLVAKMLYVIRRPERWLVCAAVRFVRTCVTQSINTKDMFYAHQLVKHNLLEPVMSAFFANGPRYNLLNSATLDLIESITQSNIKGLIAHLVDQYSHRFDEVDYVDTFVKLKTRYEQNLEMEAMGGAAPSGEGGAGPGEPGAAASGAGSGTAQEGGPLAGRRFTFDTNGDAAGAGPRAGLRPGAVVGRKREHERGLSQQEEDYFSSGEDAEDGGGSGEGGETAPAGPTITQGSGEPHGGAGAELPPWEGPPPRRPRQHVPGSEEPGSPPESPKRARPLPSASLGPSAKRRAAIGPTLVISAPTLLLPQRPEGGHLGGDHPKPDGPSEPVQPAVEAPAWQGLTEYADEDDEEPAKGREGAGVAPSSPAVALQPADAGGPSSTAPPHLSPAPAPPMAQQDLGAGGSTGAAPDKASASPPQPLSPGALQPPQQQQPGAASA